MGLSLPDQPKHLAHLAVVPKGICSVWEWKETGSAVNRIQRTVGAWSVVVRVHVCVTVHGGQGAGWVEGGRVGKPGDLAPEPPSSQAQPWATGPHTREWWQQVAEGRGPSRAHRWTHRWPSLQRSAKQARREAACGGGGSLDKLG